MCVQVKCKQDTYQDTMRVSHTILSATPVDFAKETRRLQDLIGRYQQLGYPPTIAGI